MPAIAPPLKPEPLWEAAAVAAPVPLDVGAVVAAPFVAVPVEVFDDNRFDIVEKTGSVTPWHLPVAFDVTQHESVAFSELALQ